MRLLLLLSFIGLTVAFFHGGQRHGHHHKNNRNAKVIAENFFHSLSNAAKSGNLPILKRLLDFGDETDNKIQAFQQTFQAGATIKVINAAYQSSSIRKIEATILYKFKDSGDKYMQVVELKYDLKSPTGWKMVGIIDKADGLRF